MKTEIIPIIAATLPVGGVAQLSSRNDQMLIMMADIPPCGLACLVQEMPSIGCSLVDVQCQCTSTNATQILQPCLLQKCSYNETFTLLKMQGKLCNKPHDSRAAASEITGWISVIVSIVAVAVRFLSRYIGGKKFWWDDWCHMGATTLIIPASIILIFNSRSGLGNHLWDLTYRQVKDIGRLTYIMTPLWAVNLLLLKFSILTLYIRIFPNEWLRRCVAVFNVFTVFYTVPLIFLAAFQCNPVHATWDLDVQRQPGTKCIDWIAVLRATVVFEVIAEIVLFVLPIPIVVKLQMQKSKKVLLIGFFSLGITIIGISIARLPTLPGIISTTDQTYTTVPGGVLGFAASIAGHRCAATPTVRALQRAIGELFKRLCGGDHFHFKHSNTFEDGKSMPGNGAMGQDGESIPSTITSGYSEKGSVPITAVPFNPIRYHPDESHLTASNAAPIPLQNDAYRIPPARSWPRNLNSRKHFYKTKDSEIQQYRPAINRDAWTNSGFSNHGERVLVREESPKGVVIVAYSAFG